MARLFVFFGSACNLRITQYDQVPWQCSVQCVMTESVTVNKSKAHKLREFCIFWGLPGW